MKKPIVTDEIVKKKVTLHVSPFFRACYFQAASRKVLFLPSTRSELLEFFLLPFKRVESINVKDVFYLVSCITVLVIAAFEISKRASITIAVLVVRVAKCLFCLYLIVILAESTTSCVTEVTVGISICISVADVIVISKSTYKNIK